jgi:dephospho-CoA kinase
MARNGINREEAERRIASQTTYDRHAYSRVIENNGDVADLARTARDAVAEIVRL